MNISFIIREYYVLYVLGGLYLLSFQLNRRKCETATDSTENRGKNERKTMRDAQVKCKRTQTVSYFEFPWMESLYIMILVIIHYIIIHFGWMRKLSGPSHPTRWRSFSFLSTNMDRIFSCITMSWLNNCFKFVIKLLRDINEWESDFFFC